MLIGFLRRTGQLLAQKQILSCQGRSAPPETCEEAQSVTDDRAQVPNNAGNSGEDLEHRALILTLTQSFQTLTGFLRRTTSRGEGITPADSANESREPALGCAQDPRRAAETRRQHQRINCK